MDNMTNVCKNLQLNENGRCFWHIVMLCKFSSIIGTCISPESDDFPSAYIFILTVTTVASTYYWINIRGLTFCGKPTAEPDL